MDNTNYLSALLSAERNTRIPEADDWFAPLIGDWDCDYYEPGSGRTLKGEWLFRRALDGMGVLDVFIFPSRATRNKSPQPDAEYGCATRIYRAKTRTYDMTYTCADFSVHLEVKKENGKIICTPDRAPDERWAFSRITEDSFYWENSKVQQNGEWSVQCEVRAKRTGAGNAHT